MGVSERKADLERTSLSYRALHRDRSPMEADELLDQREADARALVAAGAGAPDPVEPLEDVRQLFRRDSDAGVPDLELGAVFDGPEADRDLALVRELQGVGDQVQDDLLPHVAVDP